MKFKVQLLFLFLCISTALLSQESILGLKQQVYKNHKLFDKHKVALQQYDFESPEINLEILECLKWSHKKDNSAMMAVMSIAAGTLVTGLGSSGDLTINLEMLGLGLAICTIALPNLVMAEIREGKAEKSYAKLRSMLVQ
jgi:hypothetical protein